MLKNIYNQKITILNKLKGTDSLTGLDVWHKTVIDDAAWYSQVQRDVTNSSVVIGSYIKCFIPHHDEYLKYSEWRKSGNQDKHYTMSSGDYIVLGEIPADADITPNGIIKTMRALEPDVCAVKHVQELHDRFGSFVQLSVEGT